MTEISDINLVREDYEKCYYQIELVDNVMEHPCSLFILDKRNYLNVEEIIGLNPLPKQITRIKLEIIPTEENKIYYSFSGIETIIHNLFSNINKKIIRKNLEKGNTYFKVYYLKDEMYNIPILNLDFIFFNPLLPQTINFLTSKLRVEGLYFTGSIGKIEVINDTTLENLKKILSIPLLVGHPEFKKSGVLKMYDFSPEQIKEMNYIHGVSLIHLPMVKCINNPNISIFDDIRQLIMFEENRLKDKKEKDLDRFIEDLFNQVSEENELPF